MCVYYYLSANKVFCGTILPEGKNMTARCTALGGNHFQCLIVVMGNIMATCYTAVG